MEIDVCKSLITAVRHEGMEGQAQREPWIAEAGKPDSSDPAHRDQFLLHVYQPSGPSATKPPTLFSPLCVGF